MVPDLQNTVSELKTVEEFWNKNLCGHHFVKAEYPSKEFFEQYRQFRYEKEHHLNLLIDWKSAENKDVLEIGLGIGADGTRWAKYAQSYTGIDLTNESVFATRKHLELLGLKGNIVKGNAELLPFRDNRFDIVYSYGVIHHISNIRYALIEINRVLRKNGQLILMLYTKNSFNYIIRIQAYFRFMFFFELYKNKLGFTSNEQWAKHLSNFQKFGWGYLSWNEWPHHCTDGPDCKIANIYSKREIIKLLSESKFKIIRLEKVHFPTGLFSKKLERGLAQCFGFFQFVWVVK